MDNELTLQEMFDGLMCLKPSEACFMADIHDVWNRNYDTMFNHGYTKHVLSEFDKLAERYELNKSHRTNGTTTLHTVGGTEHRIH